MKLPSQLTENETITLTRGDIVICITHEYGKLEAFISPVRPKPCSIREENDLINRTIAVNYKTPAEYDAFYLAIAGSVERPQDYPHVPVIANTIAAW